MATKRTPLVQDAVDEYLRVRTLRCRPNTLINDASVLGRFAKWCGDVQVGGVARSRVTNYFIEEVAPRNVPSSFNKVRQRIGGFLGFCAQQGWVRADLLADVPKQTTIRRERLRLPPDRLLGLLKHAANPRDRAFLATAMNTGLRARDLTALKVGQVDLAAGRLHVFNHKSLLEDSMPITRELAVELQNWFNRYAPEPPHADWYLFPARDWDRWSEGGAGSDYYGWAPDRPIHRPAAIVQRALRSAGIEQTKFEGLHTIRRSVGRAFFDHASDLGHDAALRATASLLHHKSVVTTELYLGISEDRLKRDKILAGQSFLGGMAARKAQLHLVDPDRAGGSDASERALDVPAPIASRRP